MCTRGMRGTYLYVCDTKLREYLSKYIDKYMSHYKGITYSVHEESDNYSFYVAEESEEYK